jgi:hypothetical protein
LNTSEKADEIGLFRNLDCAVVDVDLRRYGKKTGDCQTNGDDDREFETSAGNTIKTNSKQFGVVVEKGAAIGKVETTTRNRDSKNWVRKWGICGMKLLNK